MGKAKKEATNAPNIVTTIVRAPNAPVPKILPIETPANLEITKIIVKQAEAIAGSIMKCNTWRSRKEPVILSGYGKAIPAFEH